LESGMIAKPTKGKKVTEDEFNTMRKEKLKEMEEEFGGRRGGRFRRFGG